MNGDELQRAIDALISIEREEYPTPDALCGLQDVIHAFLDDKDSRRLVNELHTQATAIRKKVQHRGKGLVLDSQVAEQMEKGLTKTEAVKQVARDHNPESEFGEGDPERDIWRTLKDSPGHGAYPRLGLLRAIKHALQESGND